MPLRPLQVTYRARWLSLDAWASAYIGTRKLVYELLPAHSYHGSAEDTGLGRLALVGANHLMEVALRNVLLLAWQAQASHADTAPPWSEEAPYTRLLKHWLPKMSEPPAPDWRSEPFSSALRLLERRNDTIHGRSALVTPEMARSALFSAVIGSEALFKHVEQDFPYRTLLEQYPCPTEPWFSATVFPEEAAQRLSSTQQRA